MSLLTVADLKVHFARRRSGWFAKPQVVHAVDGISFEVPKGRTLGIVGESGSGKSTAALAVMRLAPVTAGQIQLAGEDITRIEGEDLRRARRRMQMVFQDPYSSLNPRQRAGDIVRSPLDLMEVGPAAGRDEVVAALFAAVGLRPEQARLFPHQFSGGQRQRINIARALATNPELVVCDEPVSALDVAIRAQILNLLRRLQAERQLSYLFISHDMAVVEYMCDEVAVLYLGQVVERAARKRFFAQPLHPYSTALISAVPRLDGDKAAAARRIRLVGDPPSPINLPPGCRFASRCPIAQDRCRQEPPPLREVVPGHEVRCHFVRVEGGVAVPALAAA